MDPQLLILMAAFIEDEVRLDSSLTEDLGMNQADLEALAESINQTYNVKIQRTEIIPAYFDTVESLQNFIARKKAE